MDTVWTSRGYRVPRDPITYQTIKRDLTIFSESPQEIPGPKPRITAFKADSKYIYVPYSYGLKRWGKPKKRFKQEVEKINLQFNGKLRDYQEKIIDKTTSTFQTDQKSGLWSLGTGLGKTAMALYMISILKVKTLIMVHKKILLDQWVERISEFLPKARIGIIQGPKTDIEDKDIVIGMVQTMTQRDYPFGTFKSFGFMALDEIHNFSAKTFNDIFFRVQTKYVLGLSATIKRKDGFEKVLYHHLGDIIYDMHLTIVEPEVLIYHLEPNDQIEMSLTRFGKTNLPALVTDLGQNDTRNSILTRYILDKVKENRKILVLSDRVYQCERLHEFIQKNCKSGHISDTFIGKKKKEELEKAMKADIILATYGIFKEGVDCPKLDTLLFATPKTDIVQALGRILRQKNSNHPEVIDIVDSIGPLKNQYYKRNRYYKSKGYKITHYLQNGELENSSDDLNDSNENIKGKCFIKHTN